MKTKYFFLAALATFTFASCADSEFIGENSPNEVAAYGDGSIRFGFDLKGTTRADIAGASAAEKLGNFFYVVGTKGTEGTANPSENKVFDSYLVKYAANTADKTASNTANWEYVGVTDANHVALFENDQTIKYWDYSTAQYDFHAFSTGTKSAVSGKTTSTIGANEINVTKSLYGTGLAGGAPAYTFIVPNGEALSNLYVTDITKVAKANYGKDVVLKFKNLGAKIRIALYETVPGYSVQAGSVRFYADATTPIDEDASGYVAPTTTGTLISTATYGLPLKGTIQVSFPNVGTNNSSNANYNKASVNVNADVSAAANYEFKKTFGTIPTSEMDIAEANETAGNLYLGRTFLKASYVGDKNADFYQLVFPVTDSHPLTLRVDYTLIATDGSGETITVYGAKAVVPSTWTKWQPNYAYTYVFKIADNTNGWTDPKADITTDPEGLFPITFDAVVADFTDVSGEQTTITTVATPSITTYQQKHVSPSTSAKDEYSKSSGVADDPSTTVDESVAKNIYVQVKKANGSLAADLNTTASESTDRSILFSIPAGTTEAVVMDALEQRTTVINAANVTGRNGITLTKGTINNACTSIVNGVDDNPITVAEGTTGEIAISLAAGTYAYVYDYTSGAKTVVEEYQPVAVGAAIGESTKNYYPIAIDPDLKDIVVTTAEEDVDPAYIYFSKTTTDGGTTYTYSYISTANKATVPAGVVKLAKSVVAGKSTVAGSGTPAAGTFYFDKYFSNNGKYAVKVIKIVTGE